MKKFKNVKAYCKDDITKIENYDKAIADKTQVWHCHHRLETHKYKDRNRKEWVRRDEDISQEMLKAFNLYYDRPAEELIFMTVSDHHSLHHKNKKFSEEHKRKIGEAQKGKPGHTKGKHLSEETKQKISLATKSQKLSEETKKRISESHKGKHWKLIGGKRVYY